jgi:hypothetical protein
MCASNPKCWDWMRRVIDFVFGRFPTDGVSIQSADQGRCRCEKCRSYSHAQYHALFNIRCAKYIPDRWPRKTVGLNSWGMQFGHPKSLPSLVDMSNTIDYLIDVHNSSARGGKGYRKKLIESLHCHFGTLGGPQVEPPQHCRRDRGFLPTLRRAGEHLQKLLNDGGRACEYFFHILANPGDEISFYLAGRVLLEAAVEQVLGTRRGSMRAALAQFLLDAEEAYFRHLPADICGTISLQPLVSDRPAPPLYLTHLRGEQQREYRQHILTLKSRPEKLLPEVPRRKKLPLVVRCLHNMLNDLSEAGSKA